MDFKTLESQYALGQISIVKTDMHTDSYVLLKG